MPNELTNLSQQDIAIVKDFLETEKQVKELKAKQDLLRQDLVDIMEDYNVKKWETEDFVVTYVGETTSIGIDTKKLKEKYPELVQHFQKETKRKANVRVKLR